MKKGEKWIFIDYLKSITMLYIVGYWHLFDYTNAFPGYINPVSENITIAVLGLFTFISGFLSGKSVVKSGGIKDFYVKRLIRIYPLYFVAVILFFVYGKNDFITSVKSLLCVSMLYSPAPRTLWFITMIMLFYLAAPFLVKLASNLKRYLIAVVLTMITLVSLMVFSKTLDIRLILYLPCFCLAIYCAVDDVENRFLNFKSAIACLIVGLLLLFINTDIWTIEKLKQIPFILSLSYLVFAVSYRGQNWFPKISLISFLSFSSYAMYLFHRPIYVTLKQLYFPASDLFQVIYLFICLVMIVILSWVIQRTNDKLFIVFHNR